MALTLDGLKYIAEHHGKDFVADTINTEAPLLADKKCLEHKKKKGVELIQVRPNGMRAGSIAAGATYAQNTSFDYTTLYAVLKPFATQIKVTIDAASQVSSSGAAVDLVADVFRMGIGTLAYNVENQILDRTVATVTSGNAISGSAVTVTVDDVTRFRVGMSYVWNDNGTRTADVLKVTAITPAADGVTGTVAFSTAATGTLAATNDTLEMDDTNGNRLTSLYDLTGPVSERIYGAGADIAGWGGTRIAQGGAFTASGLNKLLTRVQVQGQRPDRIVMNPEMFRVHEDNMAGSSFRRFHNDEMDPYGKFHENPMFSGAVVKLTPNAPAVKCLVFNSKSTHLGVWNEIGPLGDKKFQIAEASYNYLITAHGQFEVIGKQRKDTGALTGVTYA